MRGFAHKGVEIPRRVGPRWMESVGEEEDKGMVFVAGVEMSLRGDACDSDKIPREEREGEVGFYEQR